MLRLTDEQKAANRFAKMLDKAREYRPSKYLTKYVKPKFQEMIRAEAGSRDGYEKFVRLGEIHEVYSPIGKVVCITCGKTGPWKGDYLGGGKFDAGHFCGTRNSVVFDIGCHPQCVECNQHNSGERAAYRAYMSHVYGLAEVERLEDLRDNVSISFTHEELVAKRIEFMDRLAAAIKKINAGS